jgi:hypothetical protein
MTFDIEAARDQLRREARIVERVRERAGMRPRTQLDELFTHWIGRVPGITAMALRSKTPAGQRRRVAGQLALWSDPDKGPFHWHRSRGRGQARHYYLGACTPDCPGARR